LAAVQHPPPTQLSPVWQQVPLQTTPLGHVVTHWPLTSQDLGDLQVPQEVPQSSLPHTMVPQPQVWHAPEMQLWLLAQQAAPQPWPVGHAQ
jgi:hypothetical protein